MSGITLDDIQAAFHSIKVSDGTNDLLIDGSGHLSFNDGGNSITVDDGGGSVTVDDGGVALSVSATDLDIRDLTHASDSVKIGDGTDFLAINADGSINALTLTNAFDVWKTSVTSATSVVGEIAATPLSGRLNMLIQNLGSQDCYIGEDNTVTIATGVKLPKGSSGEFLFGENANVWAITASGTSNLRVAEFAN